jgi:V-type H+-transporting ATPase subunit a
MLWRVCRGNVYLRQDEVEEALEDHLLCEEAEKKSAFLIFFQVKLDRFRRIYDM